MHMGLHHEHMSASREPIVSAGDGPTFDACRPIGVSADCIACEQANALVSRTALMQAVDHRSAIHLSSCTRDGGVRRSEPGWMAVLGSPASTERATPRLTSRDAV